MTEYYPIGRERTEEEKRRRHIHGDKGATFSKGKQMCVLKGGGDWMRDDLRDERLPGDGDNFLIECDGMENDSRQQATELLQGKH